MSDVERAVQFYTKLGLQAIVLSPHYARFICPEGDATFSVHLSEDLPRPGSAWVYFETEDPDEKATTLQAAGISMEEMPNNKPWLWREARLKDPDGNTIILYHAGENRLNPPWRVM